MALAPFLTASSTQLSSALADFNQTPTSIFATAHHHWSFWAVMDGRYRVAGRGRSNTSTCPGPRPGSRSCNHQATIFSWAKVQPSAFWARRLTFLPSCHLMVAWYLCIYILLALHSSPKLLRADLRILQSLRHCLASGFPFRSIRNPLFF